MAIDWNKNYSLDQMTVRTGRAEVANLRALFTEATDGADLPAALTADLAAIDQMEQQVLATLYRPSEKAGAGAIVSAVAGGVAEPFADTATLVKLHDAFFHNVGGAYPRLSNDVSEIMVMQRYDAWTRHADALMGAVRTASAPHIAAVKAFTDAVGDKAADALSSGDETEAMSYAGRENLTRYALAVDAIRKLDRLRDLVKQINRLTRDDSYTYVGALVWADLTYEQERELYARFRNRLAFDKNKGHLSIQHVLLGGYTPELADGAEFVRRSREHAAAYEAARAEKQASRKTVASLL